MGDGPVFIYPQDRESKPNTITLSGPQIRPRSADGFLLDTPADAEAGRVTPLDLLAMAQAAEAAIAQSDAPSVWLQMFADSARRIHEKETRAQTVLQVANDKLEETLDAVKRLHHEGHVTNRGGTRLECWYCGVPYPCETIRIIDGTDR